MASLERIKPAELGARLKSARLSSRVTQEVAASTLGVARTTIVAIESGERQIKPTELVGLAELYGVSVNGLLRESAVHFDLVPQFRRSGTARDDQDLALSAARTLQRLAATSVELERLLGVVPRRLDVPEYRISKARWAEQAEDLAGEVRMRFGIGVAAISDVLMFVERDVGARVFLQKLPSKVAGLFAFHPEVGACILINSDHRPERRSWTCAHELAHLLTNRDAVDVSWSDSGERTVEERFADRFAAAFLMPASTVRIKFNEIREEQGKFSVKSLFGLSRWFNVSMEAMARRLEQLELLPVGTYDSLLERGLSVREVGQALGVDEGQARALPTPRLTTLALRAHQQDFLTEGQLCELLGLNRIAARKLIKHLESEEGLEASRGA